VTHIRASLVTGEELQAKKQIGVEEENVTNHGIGFSTATSYNLVIE
jgi:hypothetical protein